MPALPLVREYMDHFVNTLRPETDYMTRNVETVKPDMDVYFAAGIFLRGQFRRLPVVEGDMLVGAITRFDILRAIKGRLRPSDEPGVVI
jgi:CBS domain-containing protein